MRQLSWFLLLLLALPTSAQSIPNPLIYCGVEIELTPGAASKVKELVAELQGVPRYYHQMVQRGHVYMPFIEEALREARVPDDLKYLAIQESSLLPSAVSSSNAVGFWQFKAPTGREMGLVIDDRIDERRHIFRATLAAGRYLAKANHDFDNWPYAVIAYYEGPTGAVAYTDPMYYSKRRMRLHDSTHWYLLKAIAHKLAYEPALAKAAQVEEYLLPHSTVGETQVVQLAAEHGMSIATFLEKNPWILTDRRLPRLERAFTYYVPVAAYAYTGHVEDPNKPSIVQAQVGEQPTIDPSPRTPSSPAPPPMPKSPEIILSQGFPVALDPAAFLRRKNYAAFPVRADLEYGVEYVLLEATHALVSVAVRHEVPLPSLRTWNGLTPERDPPLGTLLYLKKPSKSAYHVVRAGESLADIAAKHAISVRTIQKKNRMAKEESIIFIGQKLYLQGRRPKGEKRIILVKEWPPKGSQGDAISMAPEQQLPSPRETREKETSIPVSATIPAPAKQAPSTATPVADDPRIWIYHDVQAGENLWQLSRRYETKVEIIKRSNDLTGHDLSVGQRLRILVRTSVLEKLAQEDRGQD